MKAEGMEELSEMLSQLEEKAPAVAARALYEGAGIMAGAVNEAAAAIKTEPFKWAAGSRGETRLPSPEEKEIVMTAAAGLTARRNSSVRALRP